MKRASLFAHSISLLPACFIASCSLPSQPMTPGSAENVPIPEAIEHPVNSPALAIADSSTSVTPEHTAISPGSPVSASPTPGDLTTSPSQQHPATVDSSPPLFQPANPRLTREDAMALVDQWLAAKSQIFAPPYDQSLALKFLAEPLLGQMVNQIHWLTSNKAYFAYSGQSARFSSLATTSENTAILRAYVTETRTLYVNGKLDPSQTSTKTQRYRYTLNRIGDQWKISDRQTMSEENEPQSFDLSPDQGE